MLIATIVDRMQLAASYRDAIYSMREYRNKIKGNHGNSSGCGFLKNGKEMDKCKSFNHVVRGEASIITTQRVKTISTEI